MCGVTGFLDASAVQPVERLHALGRAMAGTLAHRGPDDEGIWADASAGIVLAHRRLSILDLSVEGHQPMQSADGRFVVSYNGEIYNYSELRSELEGSSHRFRGHSDTEVLLAAIVEWGLLPALQRFNGMFAFSLWDRLRRRLHLVRDRFGEKPLYYGWSGRNFLFGSELKPIRAHPDFQAEVDRNALALFLTYGYVPGPHCIYRGLSKVIPGTIVSVDAKSPGYVTAESYWSARDAAARAKERPFEGDAQEAVAELHKLLLDSVRIRMVADVPLGGFLSGGVDSSTVVALMQSQSRLAVKTFSVGFQEESYDEAVHARSVASHLQTDHSELYVTGEDALAVVPRIADLYDEPFADSSQIPTFLVAQFARRSVTVGLSGDGGDELFAGYSRYAVGDRLWRSMCWVPYPLRATLARLVAASPGVLWNAAYAAQDVWWKGRLKIRRRNPADALQTIADLLRARDAAALYRRLTSAGGDASAGVVGASVPPATTIAHGPQPFVRSFVEWMMLSDATTYLPDDILTKVDRATMGVSLEARVPFLDHRVFEFAWRLPLAMKTRNGVTKWPVREILYGYVPRRLIDRPKMGFGVPMASWLRGPLRGWAQDLLEAGRLERQGLLDPQCFGNMLDQHLSGARDRRGELWSALVFQAWLDSSASPLRSVQGATGS